MTESLPPRDVDPPRRIVPVPALPDPFRPDDDPVQPRRTPAELVRELILVAPNLVKLMYRLMRDPRLPRRRKLLMGFATMYALSPIDLIPDALFPVLGQVDDVLVVVFAINHLLAGAPEDVLREYWDGDPEALELVGALVAWISEFVPGPIRRALAGD